MLDMLIGYSCIQIRIPLLFEVLEIEKKEKMSISNIKAAILYIINSICLATVKQMVPLYLRAPLKAEKWKLVASNFEEAFTYPNCLGAINDKYIVMQPQPGSLSKYWSYKHTYSVVLLAVAGPNCECMYANVRA